MNEPPLQPALPPDEIIRANVREALAEDIGEGDITAALIPEDAVASARAVSYTHLRAHET